MRGGFLLYLTFRAEHQVDTVANREHPRLVVDVIGAKWEWTSTIPPTGSTAQRHGRTRTLVVPADEAVRFELISLDVIHAFWVPELRYKHDAIPG